MNQSELLSSRLEEIQKNNAIIDRLTRSNSLIMDSIVRDNSLHNVSNAPGLSEDVRRLLTAVLNGSQITIPADTPVVVPPVVSVYQVERGETATVEDKGEDTSQALSDAPVKRGRKRRAQKAAKNYHANLMVQFARERRNVLDLDEFRQAFKDTLKPSFFKTSVYTLRGRLVGKGVFAPIKSQPGKFRLVNASAV